MSTEDSDDLKDRFLMIGGQLSSTMIQRMDRELIPPQVDRIKANGNLTPSDETEIERYLQRDRSSDYAVYTSLAYAELPLGTRFDAIWPRESPSEIQQIGCSIAHSILYLISGFIPVCSVAKGHRHVIYLEFDLEPRPLIDTFKNWADVEPYGWEYGLSTMETARANAANKPRHSSPDRTEPK